MGHNITSPRVQTLDSKTGDAGLPSEGCGRGYLQQREVGQKAGVNLFNSVDQFNQANVSLAQPVAYQVVLSMALEHLVSWRDQTMNTGTGTWVPAPAWGLQPSFLPLWPHWAGGGIRAHSLPLVQ